MKRSLLDDALASAPPHVAARLGCESPLAKSISKIGRYGFRWHKADEYGRAIRSTMPETLGANQDRHDDARERASRLKNAYPGIWGTRSASKRIAAGSAIVLGLSLTERTVQRYMKNFP